MARIASFIAACSGLGEFYRSFCAVWFLDSLPSTKPTNKHPKPKPTKHILHKTPKPQHKQPPNTHINFLGIYVAKPSITAES
jgi:hypothetical protein